MASPRFSTYPIRLDDGAREKLLGLLGSAIASGELPRVIDRVERILGAHPHLVKNVDEAPRPSDYVKASQAVRQQAMVLLRGIYELDGYVHEAMEEQLAKLPGESRALPLTDIEVDLARLLDASRALAAAYHGKQSGGAPRKEALRHTIKALREIFHESYRGPATTRKRRGAFESMSNTERAELDFVHDALKFGLIVFPDRPGELERLFRDASCIPRALRAQAVEALAKQGRRKKPPRNRGGPSRHRTKARTPR